MSKILIASRFNGPPDSGNGGYSSGVLASLLGLEVEVTLRSRVPLDEPMEVTGDDESLRMFAGDTLVAEARTATLEIEPPPPVSFKVASHVARPIDPHPFPRCFVCGPERAPGDGLRLFAGPVADQYVAAASWVPGEDLASGDDIVRPEFMWAAMDCPSGWSAEVLEAGWPRKLALLGRMTARLEAPVSAGERCVVTSRPIGGEGRKWDAASALYGDDGSLRAVARSTWIYPRD